MQQGEAMRVLIVGAGPTGLTAAVELARLGVVPTVIDKKPGPSPLSRAVGLLPNSLRLLRPSGVTDSLMHQGLKISEVRLYFGTTKKLRVPLTGKDPANEFVIALAQDKTEEAMLIALQKLGGAVRFGTECKAVQQNDESVTVQLGDGTEEHYDFLLGADGVHSNVRDSIGIEFPGFDLPETWSIADVDATGWENPFALTLCLLKRGVISVVAPLEAERYRVISNTENALKTLPLELHVSNIRREGTFTIGIRQVKDYRRGRVFLAGDAAHCHSPAGGRGMNLGIADGAEFAERLISDTLEGYSESRHKEGAEAIADSERIRKILTANSSVKRLLTRGGCAAITLLPFLKKRLARAFLDL